jgi:hypothetical protein
MNYGLSFFSGRMLRFWRSFSFSVGRMRVKQFLSSKKVFSFLRILFLRYAAYDIMGVYLGCGVLVLKCVL